MLFFQTISTKHESFGPVDEDGECDFYFNYCENESDPKFVAEYDKAWDIFERVCPGDVTPVFIDTETEEMYIIVEAENGQKIKFRLVREDQSLP